MFRNAFSESPEQLKRIEFEGKREGIKLYPQEKMR